MHDNEREMIQYFPTSNHAQISYIIEIVLQLRPHSILDVGAGGGKYGLLCREYLMDTPLAKRATLKIDAVEAFPAYVSVIHQTVYDHVYVGDVRELAGTLPPYDLVMMIDIFEHMPKADGAVLLETLKQRAKHLLVSVPAEDHYQDAFDGNDFQVHRAQYSDWGELKRLGFRQVWRLGGNWIGLMSQDRVNLRGRIFRNAVSALLPLSMAKVLAPPFSYIRKLVVSKKR